MAGLLRDATPDDPPDRPRTRALIVNGELYANAAAKFWPALIDECEEHFPQCSLMALTAPLGELHPDRLFPEQDLQRHLDAMMRSGSKVQWEDLLAELALVGPPCPVEARLFAGQKEIAAHPLPLDSVDAETFSYMLSWALQWAAIPSVLWNTPRLSGAVVGDDPDRQRRYRMTFSMSRQHVSEGLFRRSFLLAHQVQG